MSLGMPLFNFVMLTVVVFLLVELRTFAQVTMQQVALQCVVDATALTGMVVLLVAVMHRSVRVVLPAVPAVPAVHAGRRGATKDIIRTVKALSTVQMCHSCGRTRRGCW